MSFRDISIDLLDKAAFMREGVKFCGMIFDKQIWLIKDNAAEEFLRGTSAEPIQAVSQARAELRDRFAMAALTGLLANSALSGLSYEPIAEETYEWADAMLKAREENSQ